MALGLDTDVMRPYNFTVSTSRDIGNDKTQGHIQEFIRVRPTQKFMKKGVQGII